MTRTLRNIEQFRKGDAHIQVRDPSGQPLIGVPISVEQESHEFVFGCVVPDLAAYSDADRRRYRERLGESFNRLVPAGLPPGADVCRVDVAERVPLARLRLRLEQLASQGRPLEVHVRGEAVGMTGPAEEPGPGEREAGRRVAELYTLCFASPSVGALLWNGFADGEPGLAGGGLLRRDLAPKYAHTALRKLIGSVWHTRAGGVTDEEGSFRFRGFFGTYRVVAECGGPAALVDTISLRSLATDPVPFQVTARGH